MDEAVYFLFKLYHNSSKTSKVEDCCEIFKNIFNDERFKNKIKTFNVSYI